MYIFTYVWHPIFSSDTRVDYLRHILNRAHSKLNQVTRRRRTTPIRRIIYTNIHICTHIQFLKY